MRRAIIGVILAAALGGLAPAASALPPASLCPPLPPATALPADAVHNGSFDTGLGGWLRFGYPSYPLQLTSPGACATAAGFFAANAFFGGGIYQPIVAPQVAGQSLVLDFYAKAITQAGRPGLNRILAQSHWNPATGSGQRTVMLTFSGTSIRFLVWDGTEQSVAAPTDGAWHHYQAILVGPLGLGVLLVDGLPAAVASGNPAQVDPANMILMGDVQAYDSTLGPAPDVAYDEVYLGPQI